MFPKSYFPPNYFAPGYFDQSIPGAPPLPPRIGNLDRSHDFLIFASTLDRSQDFLVFVSNVDRSQDFKVFTDVSSETGNYYVRATESTYNPPVTVPYVYREQPTRANDAWALSIGLLSRKTVVFNFWTVNLGTIVPAIKDKFQDAAGLYYQVADVAEYDLDASGFQRYKVICFSEN